MTTPILRGVMAVTALFGLAACDQPKWRAKEPAPPPPAAATAPATAPATEAPKVRAIPSDPAGTPPGPDWATAVMGKTLRDAYPKTGICKGNTDIILKIYAGQPAGVRVHGWGWDTTKKARIERVVLVDRAFKVVGGGTGGAARPDVPTAVPEVTDPNTGWNADLALVHGPVDAYGVTGDGAICPLGHLEF